MEGSEVLGTKTPVFLQKAGVFYLMAMKKPIGYKDPTWNLKTFLSISLGIHLSISIVLALIPDLRIEKLPNFKLEVSLLSMIAEEKPPSKIIPPKLKTEFKKQENQTSRLEKREEPLPQKELEPEPHLSIQAEEPKPPTVQKEMKKSETESVPTSTAILLPAQSNPPSEKVENPFPLKTSSIALPFYPAFGSKDLDENALPNIGPRESSGNASKLSSLSNGDITFTQPKYAENPKPFYPQEARKKGYQGEVMLKVEVLTNGRVGRVEVKKSSGYELLDRSASAAVKQWKFIPAKEGNEEIPFWVNIPIKFQLK
jgi:protein TonB